MIIINNELAIIHNKPHLGALMGKLVTFIDNQRQLTARVVAMDEMCRSVRVKDQGVHMLVDLWDIRWFHIDLRRFNDEELADLPCTPEVLAEMDTRGHRASDLAHGATAWLTYEYEQYCSNKRSHPQYLRDLADIGTVLHRDGTTGFHVD